MVAVSLNSASLPRPVPADSSVSVMTTLTRASTMARATSSASVPPVCSSVPRPTRQSADSIPRSAPSVTAARVSLYSGLDAASDTDHSEPTGDVSDAVVDGNDATDGSFRKRRYAQMYNWCKAVPSLILPFPALWLLVWSPARALGRILTGRASLALPEIGALVSLIGATPRLLAGRVRAAQSRRAPPSPRRALQTAPDLLR